MDLPVSVQAAPVTAETKPSTAPLMTMFVSPCFVYNSNTHLNALCPRILGRAGSRKVKPVWILLQQETVGGISAPRSRQITTPAPHLSVFYGPNALPATQLTVAKH